MAQASKAATSRLPSAQTLVGRKILVVEDDQANRRFIQEGLDGESYDFLEAGDGQEATYGHHIGDEALYRAKEGGRNRVEVHR